MVYGTDWVCASVFKKEVPDRLLFVGFQCGILHNTTMCITHLKFLAFLLPSAEEITENNITLSDVQKVTEQRFTFFESIGNAYFIERMTKVSNGVSSLNASVLILSAAQQYQVGPVR
jgi:hypothetical protein